MTDPKDELGERFDERRADTEKENNSGNSNNTGNSGNSNNTGNSGVSSNAGSTSGKPGPDRDDTATRHRRQVPMYLPDGKADELNKLYERLDGQSKVAGDGGVEKHADFMEALVELAVDHEGELAERLGINEE